MSRSTAPAAARSPPSRAPDHARRSARAASPASAPSSTAVAATGSSSRAPGPAPRTAPRRVAAPRGLEQVRPEQRVVDEPGGTSAERLGVVGEHRAARRSARDHAPRAPSQSPASTAPPAGRHPREPPGAGALGEQLPVGGPRASGRRHGQLGLRRQAVDVLPGPRGPVAVERRPRPGAAGTAASGAAERLLEATQRVAQLVLAEHLAHAERSGSRAASAARSTSTSTSRWTVARRLDRRASSACSSRFCLRFGPADVVDVREHLLERAVALDQLAGGLVADPRARRGCCPRCRPSGRRSRGSARAGCRSGRSTAWRS